MSKTTTRTTPSSKSIRQIENQIVNQRSLATNNTQNTQNRLKQQTATRIILFTITNDRTRTVLPAGASESMLMSFGDGERDNIGDGDGDGTTRCRGSLPLL